MSPNVYWFGAVDGVDALYRALDAATPDAVLASKQIAAAVNFAVEALSEDLRQAITLREIEGLSYEEIAETLDQSVSAVKSLLFRARTELRESLKRYLSA